MLLEAGSRFEDVGEPYPARLRDAPEFIARHREKWGNFIFVHNRNA